MAFIYVCGGGAGPGGEHTESKLFTSGLDPLKTTAFKDTFRMIEHLLLGFT